MLLSKNRVIRRRAVVGLLVAASLTLLTMSYREGSTGVVGSMQRGVVELTAPFASVAHRVTRPFVDGWHWTTGLVHARNQTAELKTLKVKLGLATARNRQLADPARNRSAPSRTGASRTRRSQRVSGSVIVQYHPLLSNTVMIGIGSDQGVRRTTPWWRRRRTAAGSSGACPRSPEARRPCSSCSIRRRASRPRCWASRGRWGPSSPATGTPGELNMLQVPKAVRVRKDDTVITTGSGGRLNSMYPDGLAIGRVSQATPLDGSPNMQIQVTPFVDFTNLDGVIVLETHH